MTIVEGVKRYRVGHWIAIADYAKEKELCTDHLAELIGCSPRWTRVLYCRGAARYRQARYLKGSDLADYNNMVAALAARNAFV